MNTHQHTRSSQLVPLSDEHRDGILFVKRIREGIGKVPTDQLVDYTRWFWKNHIKPHFYQEERILLPFMPAEHIYAKRLKEEHAYIRDLILSLDHDADNQSFVALCNLLDTHIVFEEKQVFTYLEENLTEVELNDIYKQLEHHPLPGEAGKDNFWDNK